MGNTHSHKTHRTEVVPRKPSRLSKSSSSLRAKFSKPPQLKPEPSHFDVVRTIGKGTFGKVFAVHHTPSGELLAMKRMSKAKAVSSRSHMKAVWAEKKILSTNKSPFLLSLKHCFQTEDDLYVTMPFMAGGDLFAHFELLDTKVASVPESWIAFFGAEIALGLEALHAMNTVYRDLKPENVLVDKDGHLALSDFGLAHELREDEGFQTRGVSGTAKYMAPEVVAGEFYGLVPDFYSFGMVMIWMFEGHSDVQRFRDGRSPNIPCYTPLSKNARDLLLRLVEENPSRRLGAQGGWDEVMAHPFWSENKIEWNKIRAQVGMGPVQPEPRSWHADKAPDPYFQRTPAGATETETSSKSSPGAAATFGGLTDEQQDLFAGFDEDAALPPKALSPKALSPKASGVDRVLEKPSSAPNQELGLMLRPRPVTSLTKARGSKKKGFFKKRLGKARSEPRMLFG